MLDTLPYIPLFQAIPSGETDLLKSLFESFYRPANSVIFEQGDPATHVYMILSGSVSIRYKPYDGTPITITRLHDGDVFGWSAVTLRKRYTSSIISETEIAGLRIRGETLWALVEEHPETGKTIIDRLARMVSPRWNNAHTQIQSLLNSHSTHKTGRKP